MFKLIYSLLKDIFTKKILLFFIFFLDLGLEKNYSMNITIILSIVFIYFLILLVVSYFTSRNSDNQSFFIGNRKSSWWLVAFGMIGTSLSGVTFISVPGTVGKISHGNPDGFVYFQMVIGYLIGYFVVAFILLPLYYKMNLTSIYTYLEKRFNAEAHKIGSLFFIVSRAIGATARLYLVINVLHIFLLKQFGIPFFITTAVILFMILLYTYEGGVKTIVFTDTLQTSFMLISLVACIIFIMNYLNIDFSQTIGKLEDHKYFNFFNFDLSSKTFFVKQILGGMFITIAMTGLDQEMMQKNISVKTLKGSQKNMISFAFTLLFVNFLFLFLGGLLYLFAINHGANYFSIEDTITHIKSIGFGFNQQNIMGDDIFPTLSFGKYFPFIIIIIFVIGLVSALFPSADGALTSLTSSFCVDIMNLQKNKKLSEKQKKQFRIKVHLSFTVLFLLLIMVFKWIDDKSIIYIIMELAGYTYGPLLGIFALGILTSRNLPSNGMVTFICILAPFLTYIIKLLLPKIGYEIGVELILINGLITFLGLFLISKKNIGTNQILSKNIS